MLILRPYQPIRPTSITSATPPRSRQLPVMQVLLHLSIPLRPPRPLTAIAPNRMARGISITLPPPMTKRSIILFRPPPPGSRRNAISPPSPSPLAARISPRPIPPLPTPRRILLLLEFTGVRILTMVATPPVTSNATMAPS